MKVHPTAIIDSGAEIHETVEIGPYTIIENNVSIDEGSVILGGGRIESGTRIGKFNEIRHGCVLGCPPQHLTFDLSLPTKLVIGDHNILREYVNIHRSTNMSSPTTIGNYNYIMGTVHLGHDCRIGDYNIFAQGSAIGGHVTFGNYTFTSALTGVHQFCRIGDYAILGGLSKVTLDIPPYMMADGNPVELTGLNAIGIRRSHLPEEEKKAVKNLYKKVFRSGKSFSRAIAELKEEPRTPATALFIKFIEESERGIPPYRNIDKERIK